MNKIKRFLTSVNWAAPVLLFPVVLVLHISGQFTLDWLPAPTPRTAQSVANHAGMLFGLCLSNILLTVPTLMLPIMGRLHQRIVAIAILAVPLLALFGLWDNFLWMTFAGVTSMALAGGKSLEKPLPSGQPTP